MSPDETKLLVLAVALVVIAVICWNYSEPAAEATTTSSRRVPEGYSDYASGGVTNPIYPTTGTAFDPHSIKLQGITRLEDLEATEDINSDKIYRAYSTMGGIPQSKKMKSAGKAAPEYLTPTDLLGEDSKVEADNILSAEFNSHVLSTGLIGASAVPRIMKQGIDMIRGANIPPKAVQTSVVGNAPVSDLSRGYFQTESLMSSSYDQ